MYDGHWLSGGLMWLFWIGLTVLVIWGAVNVGKSSDAGQRQGKTALQLLEDRFARGEIGEEEFIENRQILVGSTGVRRHEE